MPRSATHCSTMQLQYDEDFVEAAVFLCTTDRVRSVPRLHIARFHHQREKLYSILDPDERNVAFFQLHLEWFREWALEEPITAGMGQFPLLKDNLSTLAIRAARGQKDEGADLYVNEAQERTGVLSIRPERLADGRQIAGFLSHELSHLEDMIDPAF